MYILNLKCALNDVSFSFNLTYFWRFNVEINIKFIVTMIMN